MTNAQLPILSPVPPAGKFLTLHLAPDADARRALARLAEIPHQADLIVGLGDPWLRALTCTIEGFRPFPSLSGAKGAVPSTQGDLWLSLGGKDQGALLHRARSLLGQLGDSFALVEEVSSFVFDSGRDLSGYQDGTENPKGERAVEVALAKGSRPGWAGSSFVAVQRWVHDLTTLERMPPDERDQVIGRRHGSNEEIEDAPASAHVKRAAQESFHPEAFMLRRSMPWGDVRQNGLYFVAFARSLDPFERVLTRMVGLEDGIPDALFRFTRPVTGGYYFCPPVRDGRLDLRVLGASK